MAIVPAGVVGWGLGRLVIGFSSRYMDPSLGEDLANDVGFGGHWIEGPAYVLFRSVLGGMGGVYAVALTAPSHKRGVALAFLGLIALPVLSIYGFALYALIRDENYATFDIIRGGFRLVLEVIPGLLVS